MRLGGLLDCFEVPVGFGPLVTAGGVDCLEVGDATGWIEAEPDECGGEHGSGSADAAKAVNDDSTLGCDFSYDSRRRLLDLQ